VCLGSLSCWKTYFRGISFSAKGNNIFKYFNVFSQWSLVWEKWVQHLSMKTSSYHNFCTTMLHCLHSVLWLEFSTLGSPDVLSITTRPENNNFILISPQNVTPFCQSTCSLANFNNFFPNNGALQRLLLLV